MGHKDFCDAWRDNAWVKVIEANGDMSYVPLVPVVDPDLTLYDNVNQVLLSGDSSQGVKRKLHDDDLPCASTQSIKRKNVDELLEGNSHCPVLDPQEVSNCLGEMNQEILNRSKQQNLCDELETSGPLSSQQNNSGLSGDQLDCSGPTGSQVSCFK